MTYTLDLTEGKGDKKAGAEPHLPSWYQGVHLKLVIQQCATDNKLFAYY